MNRKAFFKLVAVAGAGSLVSSSSLAAEAKPGLPARDYWLQLMDKIARPVLINGAKRTIRIQLPVEQVPGAKRETCTQLEAVGRLFCGIAPWLELAQVPPSEVALQKEYRKLAIETLQSIVDPNSPDFLFDHMEPQMLVDSAFLCHALLRAPKQLWDTLDETSKKQFINCMVQTRSVTPSYSNWLLFSAMIEAFFMHNNFPFDELRIQLVVKKHLEWYVGDGTYGDGPEFHWDYYNSFVIQPMLMDIARVMQHSGKMDDQTVETIEKRYTRYAAIQERMIAPDGSFAVFGRSVVYRTGAFQQLAQASLQHCLPAEVQPAQVREALTAIMHRCFDAPETFNHKGWLQIGLAGHQPSLGEGYISTGSLYLCASVFLPLGLPITDPFWLQPAAEWTSRKLWSGINLPADKHLKA